jgi:hypothetical protein
MHPALTENNSERLDFEEDQAILKLLSNKVFRRAIDADVELIMPPDIEKETLDAVGGLDFDVDTFTMAEVQEMLAEFYASRLRWKELADSG